MKPFNFDRLPSAMVIGGGPAGLMACEVISQGGIPVDIYDSMPSAGRKFLVAGKGGLNLTHAESYDQFLTHYGSNRPMLEPFLDKFGPAELLRWIHGLGVDTFVGSSGKVFPMGMKTAPILRSWLARLRKAGVTFHMRHKWCSWSEDGSFCFDTPDGKMSSRPDVVVMALGGGSWPNLGSTGEWVPLLQSRGVGVARLKPSNCGFNVAWSEHFRSRFEGVPLKPIILSMINSKGTIIRKQGELLITTYGVEGNLIYTFSAPLRDEIEEKGNATITLDLAPDWTLHRLNERLSLPRGSQTISRHLEKTVGINGVKAGLLREYLSKDDFNNPEKLALAIKGLSIPLLAPRPLSEAISSAGGIQFKELDQHLMIRSLPGVFCAGEMLDWEAPTGGYLLTACISTGHAAGEGALAWLYSSKVAE